MRQATLDDRPACRARAPIRVEDRTRGSRRVRWGSLPSLLLIYGLLSVWLVDAEPLARPEVFLRGATVPRAKGLALDAALVKGWQVARTEPNFVVFETYLEEPASPGPPHAVRPDQTLLRIRADFVDTPAGVNAYLYAEEVWYAGSPKQWIADVTPEYWHNLANALASLQTQWAKITKASPGSGAAVGVATTDSPRVRVATIPEGRTPPGTSPSLPRPAQSLPRPRAPALPSRSEPLAEPAADIDVRIGTWAYHAEEFATARGCTLDDIGAELISGDSAGELHRVHCEGGGSVFVRCDRERCTAAQ